MSLAHARALPHRLLFSLPSPLPPGFWSLSSALSGTGSPPPQSPSAYKPCLIASSLGKNQNKEVPGLGVRFQVPGHTPALTGSRALGGPAQDSQPLSHIGAGDSRRGSLWVQGLLPPWPLLSALSDDCMVGSWVWSHWRPGGTGVRACLGRGL